MVYSIVVSPTFIASFIRRINVDAIKLAFKFRQQTLEHLKIIAVNDPIVLGVLLPLASCRETIFLFSRRNGTSW